MYRNIVFRKTSICRHIIITRWWLQRRQQQKQSFPTWLLLLHYCCCWPGEAVTTRTMPWTRDSQIIGTAHLPPTLSLLLSPFHSYTLSLFCSLSFILFYFLFLSRSFISSLFLFAHFIHFCFEWLPHPFILTFVINNFFLSLFPSWRRRRESVYKIERKKTCFYVHCLLCQW